MGFDYGQGGTFVEKSRAKGSSAGVRKGNKVAGYNGSQDEFEATQRIRLQLDAVASESLSGTVFFEIGNTVWGSNSSADGGGALGADGKIVEVRRAYIDWIVPNTDLKVRMGLQGLALPAFTNNASQVFDDDVAGIVLSNKFNDNVTLTAFWARPYNDNWSGIKDSGYVNGDGDWVSYNSPESFMDNVDMFGLLLPMSFDGVKVTPWAMVGAIGPNAFRGEDTYSPWQKNGDGDWVRGGSYNPVVYGNQGSTRKNVAAGMFPAMSVRKNYQNPFQTEYSTAFWAGITGEVTMWDPFRLAWDLNYGGVYNSEEYMNRGGFYGSLLAEYKLDWGTPGLYVWYSTGDDNNPKNGSERMASLDSNGNDGFSSFAGNGQPYMGYREGVLGSNLIGTWGIGGRLKDMSFLEGLKHTFRVNYYGGTNSPAMAKYITGKKDVGGSGDHWWQYRENMSIGDFNKNNGLYLTTMDSALEFGLTTDYKIYDNLTFYMDMAYIALWLDQSRSVWGSGWKAGTNEWIGANSITDAWNINASFVYDF